jgi:hypothetical protein
MRHCGTLGLLKMGSMDNLQPQDDGPINTAPYFGSDNQFKSRLAIKKRGRLSIVYSCI